MRSGSKASLKNSARRKGRKPSLVSAFQPVLGLSREFIVEGMYTGTHIRSMSIAGSSGLTTASSLRGSQQPSLENLTSSWVYWLRASFCVASDCLPFLCETDSNVCPGKYSDASNPSRAVRA